MNKVVLITGASKGIGKACAKKFAFLNYDIILNYNNSEISALNLKKELEEEFKIKVLGIACDVSNEEEVAYMFDTIKNLYKKIDVVVNNAGIALDTKIKDKTTLEFRRVLDVNLIGTFLISKYATNIMKKGTIINIASTDGIDTEYPEETDYAASKAGVISLTKNFAKEYAPNIRVNCVAPGWVDTEMNKEMSPYFKKKEISKILLKRFAKPEEIANVVAFLASEEASYINSSIIRVDGGVK